MINLPYKIHNNRKLLLSLVYLLMAGFLLWGYIDTFVRQKTPVLVFVLAVAMVLNFGIYFYHKILNVMEDMYV